MKRVMMAAAAVVAFAACGGGSSGSGSEEAQSTDLASMGFNLTIDHPAFSNFEGNSIWIKADRYKDADSKYPCKNHVEGCFEFDANGNVSIKDGFNNYKPASFEDLCPSDDALQAPWNFSYKIYSKQGCQYGGGEELTDGKHNFVCFDDSTMGKYPNQTYGEWLKPGKNYNDLTCVTRNATKLFDFDVCVDVTEYYPVPQDSADFGKPVIKLNCGCKAAYTTADTSASAPYKCQCPPTFELPYGCMYDGFDCLVKCYY